MYCTDFDRSNWKWPTVPGLHDFQGKLMHSADWDQSYDFTGKRIAVIGAGSSGVQIVASLYDKISRLYTWVRSPTWITTGFAQDFAAENGGNFNCRSRHDINTWPDLEALTFVQTVMSRGIF